MTPAFELGAIDAMTKTAADKKFRALRFLSRPEVFGAFSGATMGVLVSPEDDRTRYMVPGALIGAGMGFARGMPKGRRPKRVPVPRPARGGVGGPSTPTAVPARFLS